MRNQSQKKSIMDQFESVDEIRVYKGNSHDCDVECDEIRDGEALDIEEMGKEMKNNMDNNECNNEIQLDTSLDFTPTIINEDGGEFAIFDDEIVAKGSEKWNLTIYSQFVSCWMFENELRYNIRRMWSRYGLIDAQMDRHGTCYFKFRNHEGMEEVLAKGPWITKEGISALASSLGKPIRMDNTTAQICKDGKGRAEYARVLVEFDVNKGFKDEICVQYRSKDNVIKGTKKVKENGKKKESIDVKDVDGFTEVKHRKNNEFRRNDGFGGNQWREGKRNVWNRNGTYKKKKKEVVSNDEEQIKKKGSNVSDKGKDWTIQDVADKAIRISQNKFASLENLSENQELNLLKDRIIEEDRLKEAEENNEMNEDVMNGKNIAARKCSANDVNREESSIIY
ncbi:RNA-directed DNA polymerase, eukaryota, reverse transcriptase zinc-binding domain protein [Tanacetum coccineum]